MEPKWVLTSKQKKIRFRRRLEKLNKDKSNPRKEETDNESNNVEGKDKNNQIITLQSLKQSSRNTTSTLNHKITSLHFEGNVLLFEHPNISHDGYGTQSRHPETVSWPSTEQFHQDIEKPSRYKDTEAPKTNYDRNDTEIAPVSPLPKYSYEVSDIALGPSRPTMDMKRGTACSGNAGGIRMFPQRKRSLNLLDKDPSQFYRYDEYRNKHHQIDLYQGNTACERKTSVAMIDGIFEAFVPAMRTTNITEEFAYQLINLHKCKTNEKEENPNFRFTTSAIKSSLTNKERHTTSSKLGTHELLIHFKSLEKSFAKFAYSIKTFNSLCCKKDQEELLNKNSLLFVQVCSKKLPIP